MTLPGRVGASLLVVALSVFLSGCATVFSGTSQSVQVLTDPPGGSVLYQGRRIDHGQTVRVQKEFDEPQFNVGNVDSPVMVNMAYGMEPWVLGDGVALLAFVVPGLVGGAVDFGTGTWRKLEDPQIVHLANYFVLEADYPGWMRETLYQCGLAFHTDRCCRGDRRIAQTVEARTASTAAPMIHPR